LEFLKKQIDGIHHSVSPMGQRIKAIRKAKRITLDQFSKISGLDVSNISLLESGQRNPHLLTLKNTADS
jgi:transcriptional regulator with XRE-family HTH domain